MIRVKQIDQTEFAAAVVQYSTGTAFSGAINAYVNAGGYLGTGFVSITGAQNVTGVKTFLDSPRVPYYGGTGTAPTALYVNDQDNLISGALVTRDANLSGFAVNTISGALSAVRVSGSTTIPIVNLTGLNGTIVMYSGGWVFISASKSDCCLANSVLSWINRERDWTSSCRNTSNSALALSTSWRA